MSTRIFKDYEISAAVHLDDRIIMTPFDMRFYMDVETDSVREQNVAIERINYFLNYHVDSSLFIDSSLKEQIEKYEAAGLRIVDMPEEPYDQIIGLILMLKLNAIIEGRLIITDCEFGSRLSTGIKFDMNIEQAEENFSGKHWWNDPKIVTSDRLTNKKEKVIKLFTADKWSELELTWKEKAAHKS